MPLYELPERTRRRVENAFLAAGLGTFLAGTGFGFVLPDVLALSLPAVLGVPPVLWAAAVMALPGYPVVALVRDQFAEDPADGVTFEAALWAASVGVFLLVAVLLAYVLLVLWGVAPLP